MNKMSSIDQFTIQLMHYFLAPGDYVYYKPLVERVERWRDTSAVRIILILSARAWNL